MSQLGVAAPSRHTAALSAKCAVLPIGTTEPNPAPRNPAPRNPTLHRGTLLSLSVWRRTHPTNIGPCIGPCTRNGQCMVMAASPPCMWSSADGSGPDRP